MVGIMPPSPLEDLEVFFCPFLGKQFPAYRDGCSFVPTETKAG